MSEIANKVLDEVRNHKHDLVFVGTPDQIVKEFNNTALDQSTLTVRVAANDEVLPFDVYRLRQEANRRDKILKLVKEAMKRQDLATYYAGEREHSAEGVAEKTTDEILKLL